MHKETDRPNSLLSMRFFVTPLHTCSYFPDRQAVTLVVDPATQLNQTQYSELSAHGFRRSGSHIYRPHCPNCRDCVPTRIEIASFKHSRSQRRIWRKNNNIELVSRPAGFYAEHYSLYNRYLKARHPNGGMDNDDPEQYRHFIQTKWCATQLFELREANELLAVAVTDQLKNGLSAVYTYYDPDTLDRSLGTYSILRQIEECRQRGLKWFYLGYWIADSPKMRYKSRFQPFEYFDGQKWCRKE